MPRNGSVPTKGEICKKIEWLMTQSVIADKDSWEAIRYLRNEASHPKDQTIYSPGMVISVLESISECINSLFVNM